MLSTTASSTFDLKLNHVQTTTFSRTTKLSDTLFALDGFHLLFLELCSYTQYLFLCIIPDRIRDCPQERRREFSDIWICIKEMFFG